jgi:hypothetical protein
VACQEVLNVHWWVENATAFSTQFRDHGIFGILGASAPAQVSGLLHLLCMHMSEIASESWCWAAVSTRGCEGAASTHAVCAASCGRYAREA